MEKSNIIKICLQLVVTFVLLSVVTKYVCAGAPLFFFACVGLYLMHDCVTDEELAEINKNN